MKTFIFLICFITTTVSAGSTTLTWDASPTPNVIYKLYGHTNSLNSTNLVTASVIVGTGTNRTVLVDQIVAPTQWYFVATAVLGGVESLPSNQLILQVPLDPPNLRVAIMGAPTLTTGWTNLGFFYLKIGP